MKDNEPLFGNNFRKLGKPVSPENSGHRLDVYLSQNFLFCSRAKWVERIKLSEVLVDSRTVRPSYRLKAHDEICYFSPQEKEPNVDEDVKVIWELDGVKALYKPSNLPMHEGGAYRKNTFFEVVKKKVGEQCFAVHRLDRETSGIVLCAEDRDIRNLLSEELRKRTLRKTYYAFVLAPPQEEAWEVDQPIGDCKQTSFRKKKWVEPDGLPAQTKFEVFERRGNYAWLKVYPKTGRTHQIRVHAAWRGLPLIGDKKYNPDESIYLEYLEHGLSPRVRDAVLTDRLCLHAASVEFFHPVRKEMCRVDCPLPADMEEIWNSLNRER